MFYPAPMLSTVLVVLLVAAWGWLTAPSQAARQARARQVQPG